MTTDKSALVGWKGNAPKPDDFDILPETISKEPLAGFVRQDDQKWHTALTWIAYSLAQAVSATSFTHSDNRRPRYLPIAPHSPDQRRPGPHRSVEVHSQENFSWKK